MFDSFELLNRLNVSPVCLQMSPPACPTICHELPSLASSPHSAQYLSTIQNYSLWSTSRPGSCSSLSPALDMSTTQLFSTETVVPHHVLRINTFVITSIISVQRHNYCWLFNWLESRCFFVWNRCIPNLVTASARRLAGWQLPVTSCPKEPTSNIRIEPIYHRWMKFPEWTSEMYWWDTS